MSAAAIRQCGTVCEAAYFDMAAYVTIEKREAIDDYQPDQTPYTDDQARFANRSDDHRNLAIFMKPMPRDKLAAVAVSIRMGLAGDHLPYPRDFVVRKLRTFSEDEQSEAWELFGKGVQP